MQQLPDIEKVDLKNKEIPCLKWTIYDGRRKVCVNVKTDIDKVNFKTDTDNVNFVVYLYRNNCNFKVNEIDLTFVEYKSLVAKRVYL